MGFDIKALFGEKESLTPDELTEAVKSMKLIDLNEGGYVAKEKFDSEVKKHKDAAKAAADELADLKTATDGDDGLKKQVATLTEEKVALEKRASDAEGKAMRVERAQTVAKQITDARFARLALLDAESLVSDDMDFDAALAKVIEDNPDYIPSEDGGKPAATVKTGEPGKGAPAKPDPLEAAFNKGADAAD